MVGIRPDPYRATLPPRLRPSAPHQHGTVEREQQLDTVVAVRRRHEPWAPNEHHKGPGRNAVACAEWHERILAPSPTACKLASSFKTGADAARYDAFMAGRPAMKMRQPARPIDWEHEVTDQ